EEGGAEEDEGERWRGRIDAGGERQRRLHDPRSATSHDAPRGPFGGSLGGADASGAAPRRRVKLRRQRSRISAGRSEGIQPRAEGSWSRTTQTTATTTASRRWKWRPRTASCVRNTYAANRARGRRR